MAEDHIEIEIRFRDKYSKVALNGERYLQAFEDNDPAALYGVIDKQVWAMHNHFKLDAAKEAGN